MDPLYLFQVAWADLEGTYGTVNVYRYVEGADSAGGSFTMSYGGVSSPSIRWNASAAEVEIALESLPQVGDVAVSSDSPPTPSSHSGSITAMAWLVEFTTLGTPQNLGNIPLLAIDESYVTGTSVSAAVERVSRGCCTVEVSANGGLDYTDVTASEHNAAAFRYQDRAVVGAAVPSSGPASGGTQIIVTGTGFDLPSLSSSITASMRSSTNDGATCVYGGQWESLAARINSTAMTCSTPPVPQLGHMVVSVAVRWPGSVAPSLTTASFTFYEEVILGSLKPRRGSNVGGYETKVPVSWGSFAAAGMDVTCVIEVQVPSDLTDGYAKQEFFSVAEPLHLTDGSQWGVEQGTMQKWTPNQEAYACTIPGIGDFFSGIEDDDWLDINWRAIARISLSGNGGVDRTEPKIFTYTARPTLNTVDPKLGEDSGGTPVIVHGSHFMLPPGGFNHGDLLCRFGNAEPTSAQYISERAMGCVTPPHTNVPAIYSIMVGGAHVHHAVQEVILRIPYPMLYHPHPSYSSSSSLYLAESVVVSGIWTLELEGLETSTMRPNITAAEIALTLSALPNIGNVTVSASHRSSADPHAGLMWNEISFLVHFAARGGTVPLMSASTADLRVLPVLESTSSQEFLDNEDDVTPLPLRPQAVVRMITRGHDGNGVVREVQVLRTNRSELLAEIQAVVISTVVPPTAEVSGLERGVR